MPTELETKLKDTLEAFEAADARGSSSVDIYEQQVKELRKQVEKEKKEWKPPQHPALQFGPKSMTIASMAIISLGLSILELPREMKAFYLLFSRMTIVAVICLVSYTGVIWYGYTEALKRMPRPTSETEAKLAKLLKSKPERPDMWAHTRSHPSAFLTTRHAAPRLFPFPLGKTRPDASVKDELWWEGGNAPHVVEGHFNKPKLPAPPGPADEETLILRVKKSMEIETQREVWKRRIRDVQYLSCVVISYFINARIAILALCYLLYSTLAREIENMLKPPLNMDEVYKYIDQMNGLAPRTQGDLKKRKPGGGMTYIYDPSTADKSSGRLQQQANIPIVTVPAHVLMTTENMWYAGPGDPVKKGD